MLGRLIQIIYVDHDSPTGSLEQNTWMGIGDLINTVQTNEKHWMLWMRGWTKVLSEMWRLPNLKVAEKEVKEGVTEEFTKGEGL
jgi:hypothetical protein